MVLGKKKANIMKTVVSSNLICIGIQLWARILMLSVTRCLTLFTSKGVGWKPSKRQTAVTEKIICNKQRAVCLNEKVKSRKLRYAQWNSVLVNFAELRTSACCPFSLLVNRCNIFLFFLFYENYILVFEGKIGSKVACVMHKQLW